MEEVVTSRPADLITNEWDKCVEDAKNAGGNGSDEDVLTYAMFPKVAEKFFKERSKGPVDAEKAFAAKPVASAPSAKKAGSYTVNVNGTPYSVTTQDGSDNIVVNGVQYSVSFGSASSSTSQVSAVSNTALVTGGEDIKAPVAGTLLRYVAQNGSDVKKGETVLMIESMKMELEVKSPADGKITFTANPGDQITAGQVIASLGGVVKSTPVESAPVQVPATPSVSSVPSGGKQVAAPVAGTLLRYEVQEGAAVSADTTVIMIESMKMELEIKAGVAGSVHFLVAPGTQISAGQALAEIK